MGYQGSTCQNCIKMPGCKFGDCVKAFQCNCLEGWSVSSQKYLKISLLEKLVTICFKNRTYPKAFKQLRSFCSEVRSECYGYKIV